MDTAVSIPSRRQATHVNANSMRSATETPILRLLRAWEAINAEAHEYAVDDSLDIDAADKLLDRLFYGRAEAIKNELMTLPCTCAADFAAKLIVDTIKGSSIQEWETGEIWTEARRLTGISR